MNTVQLRLHLLINRHGNAFLELMPQGVMVESTADEHQLVLAGPGPVAVVDRETFARQMEYVTSLAFLEPENSFGSKNAFRQVVVEKILKGSQIKGITA